MDRDRRGGTARCTLQADTALLRAPASRALAGDSAGGAGGFDLAVGPRIYPDAWWTHRAGQRGAAGLEVPLGRVAAPLLSLARARLLTTLCLALGGLAGGAAAGAGSGASVHAAAVAVAKVT